MAVRRKMRALSKTGAASLREGCKAQLQAWMKAVEAEAKPAAPAKAAGPPKRYTAEHHILFFPAIFAW